MNRNEWNRVKMRVKRYIDGSATSGYLNPVCVSILYAVPSEYNHLGRYIKQLFEEMYRCDTRNPWGNYWFGKLNQRNVKLRATAWDLFCLYYETNGLLRELGVDDAKA